MIIVTQQLINKVYSQLILQKRSRELISANEQCVNEVMDILIPLIECVFTIVVRIWKTKREKKNQEELILNVLRKYISLNIPEEDQEQYHKALEKQLPIYLAQMDTSSYCC